MGPRPHLAPKTMVHYRVKFAHLPGILRIWREIKSKCVCDGRNNTQQQQRHHSKAIISHGSDGSKTASGRHHHHHHHRHHHHNHHRTSAEDYGPRPRLHICLRRWRGIKHMLLWWMKQRNHSNRCDGFETAFANPPPTLSLPLRPLLPSLPPSLPPSLSLSLSRDCVLKSLTRVQQP